jgi:hypothetical protein
MLTGKLFAMEEFTYIEFMVSVTRQTYKGYPEEDERRQGLMWTL